MSVMKSLMHVVAALALVIGLAAPVAAQDPPAAEAQSGDCSADSSSKPKTKKRLKTIKRADGVVVVQDVFIVCGKPPKPIALAVIGESAINYEWETQKPNFLKRVHESLKHSPF